MAESAPKLGLEDLHPALRFIFTVGGDVGFLLAANLGDCARSGLALDFVDKDESKHVGYKEVPVEPVYRYIDPKTKQERILTGRVPVYDKVHRWFACIGHNRNGRVEHISGLDLVLDGVNDESTGMVEANRIADQLRRLYGLPANPPVYRNGQLIAA